MTDPSMRPLTEREVRELTELLMEQRDAVGRELAVLGDLSQPSHSFMPAVVDKIFPMLAGTTARAVEIITRARTRIYFWPGYDSLHHAVTARVKVTSQRVTPTAYDPVFGRQLACGLCAQGGGKVELKVLGSAAAYDALLVPRGEDKLQGHHFVPPSTHRWMSAAWRPLVERGAVPPGQAPSDSADYSLRSAAPFGALAVLREGTVVTRRVATEVLVVGIPAADAGAKDLAAQIADAGLVQWPAPSAAVGGDGAIAPACRELWHRLYDVWLAANTSVPESLGRAQQLSEMLDSMHPAELAGLRKQLRVFITWALEHQHDVDGFVAWYTIRVPKALPIAVELPLGFERDVYLPELGSAMFLSTAPVPAAALGILGRWLSEVLLSIRYLETLHVAKHIGMRAVSDSFGHELKRLSKSLRGRWWWRAEAMGSGLGNDPDPRLTTLPKGWAVLPVPELVEITGRLIGAWTLREETANLFFDDWPETVHEMCAALWTLLQKTKIPLRAAVHRRHGSPDEFRKAWDELAAECGRGLEYRVSGGRGTARIPRITQHDEYGVARDVPRPGVSSGWAGLARFVFAALGNAEDHGAQQISVRVVESLTAEGLMLRIENVRRARPTAAENAKTRASFVLGGLDVLKLIADGLGGTAKFADDHESPYWVELCIGLPTLGLETEEEP